MDMHVVLKTFLVLAAMMIGLKTFLVTMMDSLLAIALFHWLPCRCTDQCGGKGQARPISQGAVVKFWGPEICISSSQVH